MSFMQRQIQKRVWLEVECSDGTSLVPFEVFDFPDGTDPDPALLTEFYGTEVFAVERVTGWAFRLSAPGYLDCTDWTGVFETAEEADLACSAMYDNDDDEETE